MRTCFVILFACISNLFLTGQVFPHLDYPKLFHDVQTSDVFQNSLTFANSIPLIPVKKIDSLYLEEKLHKGFQLSDFISTYFVLPQPISDENKIDTSLIIEEYINKLFDRLTREPSLEKGTLLDLNHPYFVSQVNSQEMFYWDSYFIMMGLAATNRNYHLKAMIINFADLIDKYGFIPNSNRSYSLSRSHPPLFALMLELAEHSYGIEFSIKYLPQLEKEYEYWMNGANSLTTEYPAYKRVLLLKDKTILNRYWDDNSLPRPEYYKADLSLNNKSEQSDSCFYLNRRAACESGWDSSARWLLNPDDPASISTTDFIPVDLNCLIYSVENTLARYYQMSEDQDKTKMYSKLANRRAKAINKYLWDKKKGFYADYNYIADSLNAPDYLSGVFPLLVNIASKNQAKHATSFIIHNFLQPGGLTSSISLSELQLDASYGWAPMQLIAIEALNNYDEHELVLEFSKRWLSAVNRTYNTTGRLPVKLNVINPLVKDNGNVHINKNGVTGSVYIYLKKRPVK